MTMIKCNRTQKIPNIKTTYTPRIIKYARAVNLDALFVNGTHDAHFIMRCNLTADQKKIYRRLLEKTVRGDSASNFRLNKSESDTLAAILYHPKYLSGNGKIAINDSNNKIHFRGTGKLSVLDSLTIDLNDSSAMFGSNNLSISDTSHLHQIGPDSDYLVLPLVYREVHNASWISLPNVYTLCFARLGRSGKTFLYLKGVEFKDLLPLNMLIEVTID